MTKDQRRAREYFDQEVEQTRQHLFTARRALSNSGLRRDVLLLVREMMTEANRIIELASSVV
jgi:hypothetical protein